MRDLGNAIFEFECLVIYQYRSVSIDTIERLFKINDK